MFALSRERDCGVRLNRLLADDDSPIARLRAEGVNAEPVPWLDAWRVPAHERSSLTTAAAVVDGSLYVQNLSSMIPPRLLTPAPGDQVLDLAAAPGSKTLQLAEGVGDAGWLSAVEPVRDRFFRLKANLKRHGAAQVHTYLKDGTRVWRLVPERFDKVLLDAPCSSEGQFVLDQPDTYRFWSERKVTEMARKQKKLLFSAVQSTRPGGVLVYSTCTFAPEENEGVVDAMLRHFGEALTVEPIDLPVDNALPGLTAWRKKAFDPALSGAARIVPDGAMEGFFICKLRKHRSTLDSN